MTGPVPEPERTAWCPTCGRRRTVEDTDTDTGRERHGEREYAVLYLDCGHTTGTPTGGFTAYPVDAHQMPYL